MILYYLGDPNVITWTLKSRRGRQKRCLGEMKQKNSKYERNSAHCCWLWKWPQARESRQPLKAERKSCQEPARKWGLQSYNLTELNSDNLNELGNRLYPLPNSPERNIDALISALWHWKQWISWAMESRHRAHKKCETELNIVLWH